jgi:iron(III) transport system ATP-binding protein
MQGVTLEGVGKRFGAAAAVDDVSLRIEPGEFVTLLGPSGCGKTTTLRMVAGLEHNDTGTIRIGERVVSDPRGGVFVAPERRQLGMVFQSYAIWPHMTVFDNVAYPLRVRRMPAAQIREKVGAALELVEMSGFADRPAPRLSGGQQQRVAIARALVFEPKVLLLDEPLSNLDAKLRAQMGDEFRALQHRLRITCLYVTHDQEEAMALSDRVVVMQRGRVLQVGAPQTIYRRPVSRDVAQFFGAPNLLEARVERSRELPGGEGWTLSVAGDDWRGECRADQGFEPGTAVLVVLRPEDLALAPAGTAAGAEQFVWPGRVADTVFRGARSTVTVESGPRRFTVEAPARHGVSVGEAVTLLSPARSAWAVRP